MSDTLGKKKVLGRGLSALLEDSGSESNPVDHVVEHGAGTIARIPVTMIEPNPFQPRSHFNESELQELALSITEHGIIQPLTLRKVDHNKYQLIAGERRFKAAQMAGMTEVPAHVRLANDEQMLEMALVENIQRADLNPLEIAISFQRLIEECQIRQDELGKKVGKDRSTISNYIRLLKLPEEIQVAVRDNLISMGHARAIINVGDEESQLIILQKILERRLSVRDVEEAVKKLGTPQQKPTVNKKQTLPSRFEQVKSNLHEKLQSRVDLKISRGGAGSIIISFRSEEDLERIIAKLDT